MSLDRNDPIDRRALRRRFDKAAAGFDDADFVHANTRQGLFDRLEPIVIDTAIVVDLGCATGAALEPLRKRFRGAEVIAVDLSSEMLTRCRARGGWFKKIRSVQADATTLPFAAHSIDVVFANLLLPWIADPATLAREVARVLRKDGIFAFSTLGPDSLLELRRAWASVDGGEHVNRFLDMHDLGDALVRAGLGDPVLDVERLSVTWGDARALFKDLTAIGARNCLAERARGLTGRARFDAMTHSLESARGDAGIELGLELVYGHCWGSGQRPSTDSVSIDPSSIPIRRRSSKSL